MGADSLDVRKGESHSAMVVSLPVVSQVLKLPSEFDL